MGFYEWMTSKTCVVIMVIVLMSYVSGMEPNMNLVPFNQQHIMGTILQYLPLETTIFINRRVCHSWNDTCTQYLNYILKWLPENIWTVIKFCARGQAECSGPQFGGFSDSAPCLRGIDMGGPASLADDCRFVLHHLELVRVYEKYFLNQNHELAREFRGAIMRMLDQLGPRDDCIVILDHSDCILDVSDCVEQYCLYYNRAHQYIQKDHSRDQYALPPEIHLPIPMFVITSHQTISGGKQTKEILWTIFGHWTKSIDSNGLTLQCNYQDFKGRCYLDYHRADKTFSCTVDEYVSLDSGEILMEKDVLTYQIILSLFNF